jgi:hypothetical protein
VSDAPLLVAGLVARVGVPVDGVQVGAVGALLDPFIGLDLQAGPLGQLAQFDDLKHPVHLGVR